MNNDFQAFSRHTSDFTQIRTFQNFLAEFYFTHIGEMSQQIKKKLKTLPRIFFGADHGGYGLKQELIGFVKGMG